MALVFSSITMNDKAYAGGDGPDVGLNKGFPGVHILYGLIGATPFVNGHKDKARFIFLCKDSLRQDALMITPYQVLSQALEHYETVHPIVSERDHYLQATDTSAYITHYGPGAAMASIPQTARFCSGYLDHRPPVKEAHSQAYPYASVEHIDRCVGPLLHYRDTAVVGLHRKMHARPVPVTYTQHQVWCQSRQKPLYDVIETNHTLLLGGLLGFVGMGLSAGAGLAAQCRWDITSHRKISGREEAYGALEMEPPQSVAEVLSWQSPYTDIRWSQLRGLKVLAGIYTGAHAGVQADLEGIWEHRVRKENQDSNNTITVGLSLKKRARLKVDAGIFPVFFANKDIAQAAKKNEIQFKFVNVDKYPGARDPRVRDVLDRLIKGHHDQGVIKDAIELSDEYAQRGWSALSAPISLDIKRIQTDHDSRDRIRARLSFIANAQRVKQKRERIETQTFRSDKGEEYTQNVLISEVARVKSFQYPIESALRSRDDRIHPQRVGIDAEGKVKWPLDYRNSNFEEITQVKEKQKGDMAAPYEVACAKYVWSMRDNYITRDKALASLKQIGKETGLGPLLFQSFNIPEFRGCPGRPHDSRESMQFSLEIHLRDEDEKKIFSNILTPRGPSFVDSTVSLFDSYISHPNGDYLGLASGYSSKEMYASSFKPLIIDQAKKVVNKFRKANEKLSGEHKKASLFGALFSGLTEKDKMHITRDLLDSLKANPFIFLAALNGTSPNSRLFVVGTSVNIDRMINVSLARNIMANRSRVPDAYTDQRCPRDDESDYDEDAMP